MKRILTVIVSLLFLCSCETVSEITKNPNVKINENMMSFWNVEYDTIEKAASSSRVALEDTDLVYCIVYYDSNETEVGSEYYYSKGDILMYTRMYYRRGTAFKDITEYNRDFYDHFDEYDLPEEWYSSNDKEIYCSGELNALMLYPNIQEFYWNNGIRTYRRTLLTEEGNGTYVDLDEMYNPDGDLIYMVRDDENGHVYGEYYEYEDGIMTISYIRDFLEMKATVTQYKNGEPELREIWSIDEEGVLVDLLETVPVN